MPGGRLQTPGRLGNSWAARRESSPSRRPIRAINRAIASLAVELERDGLRVRYEYRDDDGTGVLTAEVRFGGFAGESRAWFSDGDLLEFADHLRTYPLGEQQFHVSGGYRTDDGVDEHVGMTVRAIGFRGLTGVAAHLATPPDRVDYGASVSEVRVEVLTSYEALGRFASELRNLVAGNLQEAWLDADLVGAS